MLIEEVKKLGLFIFLKNCEHRLIFYQHKNFHFEKQEVVSRSMWGHFLDFLIRETHKFFSKTITSLRNKKTLLPKKL